MWDRTQWMRSPLFLLVGLLISSVVSAPPLAWSHHVLGRPSYSLNEDSNTPPSMQLEVQIGRYLVTMMAFPAFPKVGEESRIRLYAAHLESGEPFIGEVQFSVRDDRWFADPAEILGVQRPIDGIYRQSLLFSQEGDYWVTTRFEAGGEPYIIDLPIRMGNPASVFPILATVGFVALLLLILTWRKWAIRRAKAAKLDRVARQRASP